MPIVSTERMVIFTLSDEEMEKKIEEEADIGMKKAYSEMLCGCRENPEQRIWYAIWVMKLNDGTNRVVGDLSFKGINKNGVVEIGYGINPKYEGQGFMTEAVIAMVNWASNQSGVTCVEAEAEANNYASKRVLEKAGFVPNGVMGDEGPRFVWKQHTQ